MVCIRVCYIRVYYICCLGGASCLLAYCEINEETQGHKMQPNVLQRHLKPLKKDSDSPYKPLDPASWLIAHSFIHLHWSLYIWRRQNTQRQILYTFSSILLWLNWHCHNKYLHQCCIFVFVCLCVLHFPINVPFLSKPMSEAVEILLEASTAVILQWGPALLSLYSHPYLFTFQL